MFPAPKISLGDACSSGEFCIDDNSRCERGTCRCHAGFTRQGNRCGELTQRVVKYYFVYNHGVRNVIILYNCVILSSITVQIDIYQPTAYLAKEKNTISMDSKLCDKPLKYCFSSASTMYCDIVIR